MRIGVSLRSSYPTADARVGATWMVERAAAASAAGLDSLFVGDHHVTGSPYYQNSPVLGRVLAEWGDRPAGALYLLPLWHPVLLAEQVGTLASIARGRFILQCGLGEGEAQFAGMGATLRTRGSTFEASLNVVRRLLEGECVDADEPVPIRGAQIGPLPSEPVDVWIGASAPAAIDRAGRLGDGWLAGPNLTLQQAGAQIDLYRQRCLEHGRGVGVTAIRRDVHVAKSASEANRVATPIIEAGYRGFTPEALAVGSVDDVVEAFARLGELGYTDVIVRHLAEDQGEVLASFECLAEVRRALA